jgi:hypothetical protein
MIFKVVSVTTEFKGLSWTGNWENSPVNVVAAVGKI